MNYNEIRETEQKYIMPSYSHIRMPAAFVCGRGSHLFDTDGKKYIDFAAGIGVNSIGYGDEEWAKAVSVQALMLAHSSNYYINEPSARLAKKLVEFSGLEGKVFFGNSGAEANEGMIKLARKYSYDKYGPGRDAIITIDNSFHGRTVTTLSATAQPAFHNYFFPFTEGFSYAEPNMASVKAVTNGGICAVMLECIQGEGGVIPLDRQFLYELQKYAAERDWLLLVDEVQTGIGRTGDMFAYQRFGINPDAFTLAKGLAGGLPIGALVSNKKTADVLCAGMHGTTFGSNPAVCAGALAVLDKVGNPEFLADVERKGEYIKSQIKNSGMPVSDIRGEGLMIGIDLSGIDTHELQIACLKNGLVTLTAKKALRFLPPLIITDDEIDEGIAILIKTVNEMAVKK